MPDKITDVASAVRYLISAGVEPALAEEVVAVVVLGQLLMRRENERRRRDKAARLVRASRGGRV